VGNRQADESGGGEGGGEAETAEGGATRAVATRVVAAAKVELARDLVESFDYKAFKDFAARRFCE